MTPEEMAQENARRVRNRAVSVSHPDAYIDKRDLAQSYAAKCNWKPMTPEQLQAFRKYLILDSLERTHWNYD